MYILISAIKKKENWPALCKKYSYYTVFNEITFEREKNTGFCPKINLIFVSWRKNYRSEKKHKIRYQKSWCLT